MSISTLEDLRHLLKAEKELLLSGDLASVGAMVSQKEAITTALEAAPEADLGSIVAQLEENSRLLIAARQGVSHVVETLKKQRAARTTMSSYDRSGSPTQIRTSPSETVRKY